MNINGVTQRSTHFPFESQPVFDYHLNGEQLARGLQASERIIFRDCLKRIDSFPSIRPQTELIGEKNNNCDRHLLLLVYSAMWVDGLKQ